MHTEKTSMTNGCKKEQISHVYNYVVYVHVHVEVHMYM